MAWLGISAVVLLIAGVLLPPILEVIFHRSFGGLPYALVLAGTALYVLYLLLRRPRGNQDTPSDAGGGVSDSDTDFGSDDSIEGGHGGDGGDGGH